MRLQHHKPIYGYAPLLVIRHLVRVKPQFHPAGGDGMRRNDHAGETVQQPCRPDLFKRLDARSGADKVLQFSFKNIAGDVFLLLTIINVLI